MRADKLSLIFQVSQPSVYLTTDNNIAIFPEDSGYFSTLSVTPGHHYEVHGVNTVEPGPSSVVGNSSLTQSRFTFQRPPATSAAVGPPRASASPRPFQRSVHIADVSDGKLIPAQVVIVRFTESEATVSGILGKVKNVIGRDESLVLTDSQGNEIIDSEGTTGSLYWRQNSRKVYAVQEQDFLALHQERERGKRKRLSRSDSTSFQSVQNNIEELLLVSQNLGEVTKSIQVLTDVANSTKAIKFVTDGQSKIMKEAFMCVVCKGLMAEPMFATCCNSLIGCKVCVQQWQETSDQCMRCRGDHFSFNVHRLAGLTEVLGVIQDIVQV
ncbi:uncharacterized protein LOC143516130 [Brachyhypopomus gauderio]|uniref:uncharacterized protein LOC143516130 n=1 Tax=Brachyhypopomus gauderio TaxID=698409 RepID=UPI004041DC30